jgi:hypothetical protein
MYAYSHVKAPTSLHRDQPTMSNLEKNYFLVTSIKRRKKHKKKKKMKKMKKKIVGVENHQRRNKSNCPKIQSVEK